MKDTHNSNEYHKYESTTKGSNNVGGSGVGKPSLGGWIIIIIVICFLISALSDGFDVDVIDRILGFGLIAFLFINWLTK